MIFLYTVIYADETLNSLPIIGSKFMPTAVVNTCIAFTVVIVAVTFLGFAGSITESKIAIEAYTMILSICTIALLCEAAFVTYYAFSFDSYYETNWGKLPIYMDAKYFTVEEMGCYGGKYMFS